ncbi:hypothetical protein SEA_VANLEE_97 [Gordonia phage VanLee]|uniref:Uncharacterized protein n=1 Tax=Gordonia phage VanLee TaxID=2845816 RepID=A0A8F2D9H0_9CAUD|nr:hypothetical protein QEH49_gp097 [Gordonia phage VanLee]QWS68214.1 hypothetical protein SEA_VANLEE_97 [Gordonia phage VanLee]
MNECCPGSLTQGCAHWDAPTNTERTTAPMSDYTDSLYDRSERRAARYAASAPDLDDFGAGDPSMSDAFPPSAGRHITRTTERTPMTHSLALPPVSPDLARRIENAWAKAAPAVRDKSTIESIPEPPEGAVITFSKRYATSPKTYLFAALKVKEDEWSLTGRETKSMTWVQLLQFIGGGQDDGLGLRTVRIATDWVGVADDE